VTDFPVRPSHPISTLAELGAELGAVPLEVLANEFNLALLESEQLVRELAPNTAVLARIG
jgi:hypothetical protein